MKIRPVEAELLIADERTDRWTDMTKLIVIFRNFSILFTFCYSLQYAFCQSCLITRFVVCLRTKTLGSEAPTQRFQGTAAK